jgi:hypothetical protein
VRATSRSPRRWRLSAASDIFAVDGERLPGPVLTRRSGSPRPGVAYLGTDRDLGVIIEIFSGTPDERPQPV